MMLIYIPIQLYLVDAFQYAASALAAAAVRPARIPRRRKHESHIPPTGLPLHVWVRIPAIRRAAVCFARRRRRKLAPRGYRHCCRCALPDMDILQGGEDACAERPHTVMRRSLTHFGLPVMEPALAHSTPHLNSDTAPTLSNPTPT
jgi:hypothetical protein